MFMCFFDSVFLVLLDTHAAFLVLLLFGLELCFAENNLVVCFVL